MPVRKAQDVYKRQGFVREIISKVQTMRKEADFNVTDHIAICIKGSQTIEDVMQRNSDEIAKEVLADEIADALDGYAKDWDINGEKASITVAKR